MAAEAIYVLLHRAQLAPLNPLTGRSTGAWLGSTQLLLNAAGYRAG